MLPRLRTLDGVDVTAAEREAAAALAAEEAPASAVGGTPASVADVSRRRSHGSDEAAAQPPRRAESERDLLRAWQRPADSVRSVALPSPPPGSLAPPSARSPRLAAPQPRPGSAGGGDQPAGDGGDADDGALPARCRSSASRAVGAGSMNRFSLPVTDMLRPQGRRGDAHLRAPPSWRCAAGRGIRCIRAPHTTRAAFTP